MANNDNPQGWYSRGYIPDLDTPGLLQFITFHLGDSLPKQTLLRLLADTQEDDAKRFRRLQRQPAETVSGLPHCGRSRLKVGVQGE